jgi:hypothetical protein
MIHGQDVRGVYGDLLQFLPLESESQKYQWRVTNNASQEILEGDSANEGTGDHVANAQSADSARKVLPADVYRRFCERNFPGHQRVLCVRHLVLPINFSDQKSPASFRSDWSDLVSLTS